MRSRVHVKHKKGQPGTEDMFEKWGMMGSGMLRSPKKSNEKASKKEAGKITEEEKPKPEGGKMAGRTGIVKGKKIKKKKPVKGILEGQGYMDLYETPSKKAKKKRRWTKVDEEV